MYIYIYIYIYRSVLYFVTEISRAQNRSLTCNYIHILNIYIYIYIYLYTTPSPRASSRRSFCTAWS